MKTLIDGTMVPDHIYYYLLAWNEKDSWKFTIRNFGGRSIRLLNRNEFRQLFDNAIHEDLKAL